MTTLIQGYDGSFSIDSGAIGYLTEVNVEVDQEVKKQGPFIGNSTVAKVRGGKDSKGSAKGVMVDSMDSGQQDVIDAIGAGTDVALVLEIGTGPVQTYTSGVTIISNFKIGQKADSGVEISFDFEAADGYTLV